jgi:hypothetical protein
MDLCLKALSLTIFCEKESAHDDRKHLWMLIIKPNSVFCNFSTVNDDELQIKTQACFGTSNNM